MKNLPLPLATTFDSLVFFFLKNCKSITHVAWKNRRTSPSLFCKSTAGNYHPRPEWQKLPMQVLIVILAQFLCRKTTHKCSLSLWTQHSKCIWCKVTLTWPLISCYTAARSNASASSVIPQSHCLCPSSLVLCTSQGDLRILILTDRANSTPCIPP